MKVCRSEAPRPPRGPTSANVVLIIRVLVPMLLHQMEVLMYRSDHLGSHGPCKMRP